MEFVSTREAAELLHVSESTVRRLFDRRVLTGFTTEGGHRKISKQSVEKLLAARAPVEITFP